MLYLDVSYMIHLARCQHMMKHCLSDWVRHMCERACTIVLCASQVLSIGHHQRFMYLSFTYLKKKYIINVRDL